MPRLIINGHTQQVDVDPDIAFKKLGTMAEGAAIASKRLWGRA